MPTYYKAITYVVFLAIGPLIATCVTYAQQIVVKEATNQPWSGGIAGHSGNNYHFLLAFSNVRGPVLPDTLWVGDHPEVLTLSDSSGKGNMNIRVNSRKSVVTVDMNIGTSHDSYIPFKNEDAAQAPRRRPRRYNGVALLSYKYQNRNRQFVIPKFTAVFPPVNYP